MLTPGLKDSGRKRCAGFSSVLASFYVTLFAAVAVAYTAMSGTNAEISGNTRAEQEAYAAAESGASILRYHMASPTFDSELTDDEVFAALGAHLADTFNGTANLNGQSVSVTSSRIHVPAIATGTGGAGFQADITRLETNFLLTVTGTYRSVSRSVRVQFAEQTGPPNNAIMNNGVISRGSILLNGSATLRSNRPGGSAVMSLDPYASHPIAVNGAGVFDGDFYTIKEGVRAQDIFSGTAQFLNADGTAYETNAADHVHAGIPEPPWPKLDVSPLRDLALSLPHTTVTSGTNLNGIDSLNNVYVEPNANPKFKSGVTITGIVYVAYPNDVTFNGSLNITGMIICEPPPYEPSVQAVPNRTMRFNGAVTSSGAENLPQTAEHQGLHDKIGSFVIAPDFQVTFNGAIGLVNGSIYASTLTLNGTTTGTVRGSIIVDRRRSDSTLTKNGSVDLMFEVNDNYKLPTGLKFGTINSLKMVVSTYQED